MGFRISMISYLGFFFFLDFCEMGFADLLVLLLDLCRSRCWVL